jgi:hypothetical protein
VRATVADDQPAVAPSVAELLAGATSREPMRAADSKSGARFERVVIGGERFVVKYLHVDDDWIQRGTGDVACRPALMWRSGLLRALPAVIDHAVVGVADGLGRHGWGAAVLMRDVGPWLVPEGDTPLAADQEDAFIDHMAAMHARFWGFSDEIGLMPLANRYLTFGHHLPGTEARLGSGEVVPVLVGRGWQRLRDLAPGIAGAVADLLAAPWPLVAALERLPRTLVHGDWKCGNLGTLPDGRTVLLDWAMPGEAPPLVDLGWYLAVNSARLSRAKERLVDDFRAALERHGVVCGPWWDAAVDLCLLGAFCQLGWNKALDGPGPELDWWQERVRAGLARL